MSEEKTVRMHMLAEGRVQGVGFRSAVVRLAARYQLVGYVKNLANDTVEIEAQGGERQLQFFIESLLGLTGAIQVEALHKTACSPVAHDNDFNITY